MTKKYDAVEKPEHYNQGEVECIDAIRAMLGTEGFIAYCQGNALKYTWRHQYKGKAIEDLQKAQWYMNRIIATERLKACDEMTQLGQDLGLYDELAVARAESIETRAETVTTERDVPLCEEEPNTGWNPNRNWLGTE